MRIPCQFPHGLQVRIAAAFYDTATGETVTVQDASRTHKRKHHINTLAIQVRGVGTVLSPAPRFLINISQRS